MVTHDLTAVLFDRSASLSTNNLTSLIPDLLRTLQQIASSDHALIHEPPKPLAPHVLSLTFTSPSALFTLLHHPLLTSFEKQHTLEIAIIPTSTHTINGLKLAVFDMDSTLIQQEVIDLLAAHAGVEPLVASITARAMNGELDFSASLRERVRLLKGLQAEETFEGLKIRGEITLTPGAEVLLKVLKRKGVKTALLSGGFTPLARWVAGRLGIDVVHANFLEVDGEGNLTGELEKGSTIVDAAFKRQRLEELAKELSCEEGVQGIIPGTLAVGDGANDLLMLGAAGLGVAVNAKEKVQKVAPCRLNGKKALEEVLYLLGMTEEEIDEANR